MQESINLVLGMVLGDCKGKITSLEASMLLFLAVHTKEVSEGCILDVKELSVKTKMPTRVCSKVIGNLIKKGYIKMESVEDSPESKYVSFRYLLKKFD